MYMDTERYMCRYCGTGFTDRSNRYRHETKWCKTATESSVNQSSRPKIKTKKKIHVKPKTPITVKKRQKATSSVNETADSRTVQDLMQEIHELRERVTEMEQKPRYNNWIIVGDDMFHAMVDKFGRTEALSFLTQSAIAGDSIEVVKKLYLDGVSPEKYPIACRDVDHYRYLNDKRQIIDDKGGESVKKMLTNQTHRAMVLATNEVIQSKMDQSGIMYVDLDHDMKTVQCKLANMQTLDMHRLSGITNNPNHPFFTDDDEVITYNDCGNTTPLISSS